MCSSRSGCTTRSITSSSRQPRRQLRRRFPTSQRALRCTQCSVRLRSRWRWSPRSSKHASTTRSGSQAQSTWPSYGMTTPSSSCAPTMQLWRRNALVRLSPLRQLRPSTYLLTARSSRAAATSSRRKCFSSHLSRPRPTQPTPGWPLRSCTTSWAGRAISAPRRGRPGSYTVKTSRERTWRSRRRCCPSTRSSSLNAPCRWRISFARASLGQCCSAAVRCS
mmetsp:Transcript_49602/g.98726  ORF Transcript_49602/g.98726 Transcript_49602/m.98726 type:complete len:221 (+) Transcript_49602:911-1573(+)